MMVSLPPLDLNTMRWAEVSAEISIVSSPASPSIVMVLRRRLVEGEVAEDVEGIAARSAGRRGIDAVDADFLDLLQFRDDRREVGAITSDNDFRRCVQRGGELPARACQAARV